MQYSARNGQTLAWPNSLEYSTTPPNLSGLDGWGVDMPPVCTLPAFGAALPAIESPPQHSLDWDVVTYGTSANVMFPMNDMEISTGTKRPYG